MSDVKPQPSVEPAPITDGGRRVLAFARRHPALTVVGVLGVGLIGGFEVAAGVLLGAGVTALVRAKPREAQKEHEEHHEPPRRSWIDRVSPEMRKRGRALVQAARGKLAPTGPGSVSP